MNAHNLGSMAQYYQDMPMMTTSSISDGLGLRLSAQLPSFRAVMSAHPSNRGRPFV